MGSAVYVWPMHILGGVYADLHRGSEIRRPYTADPIAVTDGTTGQMIEVEFNIERSPVVNGPIHVRVAGARCYGGDAPQRSAAINMVEALRTDYGVFPLDYNYIVLSEKRALYDAMCVALYTFRGQYGETDDIMKQCQSALCDFLGKTSAWLCQDHPRANFGETVAVAGLHAAFNTYAPEFRRDTLHAGDLVDMLMARDVIPEEQRQLDLTVPRPMVIDWEGSYYLLRTIYNEAASKLNGNVFPIKVVEADDGLFKATVDTLSPPHVFWGPSAPSPLAAKAKLLFEVIKHVNKALLYDIFDLHYTVRAHQEDFIDRFDHKMNGIYRCGQKLQSMLYFVQELFGRNVDNVLASITENPSSLVIQSAIEVFGDQLIDMRVRFDEVWGRFITSNVDTQMVMASLAAQN